MQINNRTANGGGGGRNEFLFFLPCGTCDFDVKIVMHKMPKNQVKLKAT